MSATLTANKLIQKEQDFKSCIKKQHASTNFLAGYISFDGDVEKAVRGTLEEGSDEMKDFESFLDNQRSKVKSLTEKHIASMRHVDAFISAVQHVKTEIENGTHNSAAGPSTEDGGDEDIKPEVHAPPNFEEILRKQVETQKELASASYIDVADEKMMKTVRERLRERTGGNNDDDDVIEELPNKENEARFKCPVLGTIFENPVKNKFCGHTYDLKGIKFYLQTKKGCPVAGCINEKVEMSQLEEDDEMKMKVKRFNLRAEREKRQRLTQDDDLLDVDNDEMEDGGTTYID